MRNNAATRTDPDAAGYEGIVCVSVDPLGDTVTGPRERQQWLSKY